jgi:biopolymer transport protein ExbD
MKALFAIATFALGAAAARAEIVFQGYMTSGGRVLFVVSLDQARTSGWLAIGQRFEGVSLVAFDAKAELLMIEKDGERQVIHLASEKAQPAGDAPNPAAKKPIIIAIGAGESLSIGDDAAMLDALKKRLEIAAATVPQPVVTVEPPADLPIDRLNRIMDLLRLAGIKRVDLLTR